MKIYFIIAFIFVDCEIITSEQIFKNVEGLQQVKLDKQFSDHLEPDQKYLVTLRALNGGQAQLIICNSVPEISPNTNIDDAITQYDCSTDKLSYTNKNSNQVLTLTKNDLPTIMSNSYHIFQLNKKNPFIGAYSEQIATFSVSITINPILECAKFCQNGGKCVNGYCSCLVGYFYDDCSVEGTLLTSVSSLIENQTYYLPSDQSQQFQILLTTTVLYIQSCIVDNPNLDFITTNMLDNINIPLDVFKNCEQSAHELSLMLNFSFAGAIVIQIHSNSSVFIITQATSGSDNNTLILSLSISFSIFIVICIFCICLIKKRKKNNQPEDRAETLEAKTLIDTYMPVQTYKDVQGFENSQECTICLENFKDDSQIRITYCHHIYHIQCLSLWMKKNFNCPICRQSLEVKQLEEAYTQGNIGSKDFFKPWKPFALQSFDQTQQNQLQFQSRI